MARVLLAFYNGIYDQNNLEKIPCWYDGLIKGLKKNGHQIFLWQIREFGVKETSFSEADRNLIKTFDPELCLSFNNVLPDEKGLIDCPVITIIVDSVKYLSNIELLKSRIIGTIQKADFQYLVNNYKCSDKKIFLYNPYTEIKPDKSVSQDVNISFIGTRFGVPRNAEIGAFANDREALMEYCKCIEYIKRDPLVSEEIVLNACNVTKYEVREKLNVANVLLLLSAEKRVRILSAVVDLGLQLYGTRTWLEKYHFDSRINMAFVDKEIYSLDQNQLVYNRSKIGINISHMQAVDGFPWRILDIMSSNACLVTDWHEGFKKYFGGLYIPIYQDEFEARDICKELLKDEMARRQIVNECNDYIKDKFSLNVFLKQLQELTGVSLLEKLRG